MAEPLDDKAPLPLEGIRVLDLGTMTPGKYCTLLLADLGADVIRVERHSAVSASIDEEDLALNRNKRSITLNLRTHEAREVFYKLVRTADVVLESNRPGAARRLGVDYETLRPMNPRLVYCSLSGFGQDGPYAQLPGFDLIFMAIGGLLGLMAEPGRPPRVPGIYVSDAGSGLMAAIGILTALVARQRTGQGQHVDIAMLDTVISILSTVSGFLRPSGEPAQAEYLGGWALPGYHVYEARDGKCLALGIFRPRSWQALCQALGRQEYADQQWATGEKRREILAFLQETFRTRPRDEWCAMLRERDIEVGPVHSLPEVYSDPQVLHRRMAVETDHPAGGRMKQLGIPIKLSETPGRLRRPAPSVGQDTEAVLAELGYNDERIQALRAAGAI